MNKYEVVTIITPVISFIIATLSFIYTWRTNTKKYELSESLRREIITWYYDCIKILISLRKSIETNHNDMQKMLELN